jgi:hypothetical protein
LDNLLLNRPQLRELPFFKREALAAISENGAETRDEGIAAVSARLMSFYTENYPEVLAQQNDLVVLAARLSSEIYGESHFPEMNTSWETHPNHIGHDDFPGCWRCHDDEMATPDGSRLIPMDCENCHLMLVEDEAELPDFGTGLM